MESRELRWHQRPIEEVGTAPPPPPGFQSSRFEQTHRDEILAIVRNEERRARDTNPLERIMEIREGDGRVEILTTDEKLAQRIGREIRKAYQGSVSYKWSEDANLVRVDWSRDD